MAISFRGMIPPIDKTAQVREKAARDKVSRTERVAEDRTDPPVSSAGGDRPSPRQAPRDTVSIPGVRLLEPGEVLFEEGDPGDMAYFVEEGVLDIFLRRGGEAISVNTILRGQVVGEMAVIDSAPRSSSVRAAAPTRLREIAPETLHAMVNRADPGLQALLKTLLNRLRLATNQVGETNREA
ncbi:MAG: cyclic nucleotide-binding domain-containing protein [Rhodospirillum sp.]|nr:cyclic nucleotide-binding domain-containing protein [Rhodospirillum sp.]MCF8488341.1 cyclic nucleotide-binding domain-containing protein [Rhodospirillum sp.]MCF8502620.1 cyclic nucleotide-binding domain-containing protein [Rhodospirillum sp.]